MFRPKNLTRVGHDYKRTPSVFSYDSPDILADVVKTGYFSNEIYLFKQGDIIHAQLGDVSTSLVVLSDLVTATQAGPHQPYINLGITQNQSNTYTLTAAGDSDLYPPESPQPLTGGDYEGYVKMSNFEDLSSFYMSTDGSDVDFDMTGKYRVDGFANFAHSHNNSTVAFVFAVNTGTSYVFSPRPVRHRVPNLNDSANMAGEGIITVTDTNWSTSLWVASDISGTVTVDTLSIIISRFAD